MAMTPSPHQNVATMHTASLTTASDMTTANPTSPTKTPTVREAVFALLRDLGINRVFGNPGSTELPMFRDFPEDFEYVLGLQEAVVVGMADGYAQATRNASFVNLHSAAGVGHAMGNIFTAFRNRTPMVITAGQQARSLLPFEPFLFSAQATELPKPYVKWSCEPARAADVPMAIARAYHIAMQEPQGPVLVSIPVDDWDQPAEPVAHRVVSTRVRPDPEILERIGAALDAAERPAFVVGAAVDRGQAWHQVVELAERHNARVFGAPMAGRCSFPADHRLFGGYLPAMREHIVARLTDHDVVFVIGAPAFTYHVEGFGPHVPPGTTLLQLIEDPAIASWAPVGTAAVGNIRLGLLDLLARTSPPSRPLPPPRDPIPEAAPPAPGERMSAAYVAQVLQALRQPGDVLVEEAPGMRVVIQDYMPTVAPDSFYTMCSGGLGHSLPAAVGISMAQPQRRVIVVIGDGSSMYAIQALWSAAQLKLPMTIVVLNNGRYAALQRFAKVFGYPPGSTLHGTDLSGLDFALLAEGHGCRGVRVETAQTLQATLQEALQSPTPVVVDVLVQ